MVCFTFCDIECQIHSPRRSKCLYSTDVSNCCVAAVVPPATVQRNSVVMSTWRGTPLMHDNCTKPVYCLHTHRSWSALTTTVMYRNVMRAAKQYTYDARQWVHYSNKKSYFRLLNGYMREQTKHDCSVTFKYQEHSLKVVTLGLCPRARFSTEADHIWMSHGLQCIICIMFRNDSASSPLSYDKALAWDMFFS